MNAIFNSTYCILCEEFRGKRKGESMQYLAAIVCIIALAVINIFGKESTEINAILSSAIMALVWGGVQRAVPTKRDEEGEKKPTPKRRGPIQ